MRNHEQYTHIGTQCAWPGCNARTPTEAAMRRHLTKVHYRETVRIQRDEDGKRMSVKYACNWPGCDKLFSWYSTAQRCHYLHAYRINQEREAQAGGHSGEAHGDAEIAQGVEDHVDDAQASDHSGEAHGDTEMAHGVEDYANDDQEATSDAGNPVRDGIRDANEDSSADKSPSEPDSDLDRESESGEDEDSDGQVSQVIRTLKSISAKFKRHRIRSNAKIAN
ncbi:hypothetical protein F4805DRAFT_420200 [Annulohypoxylon moriforme]|nr:hypothetical protein F4805DRAFT_420200 [Annulohypoxylon moriforme]